MTHKHNNRLRGAFTIIEIIVVLAISLILFGLLIRPLIDALRYSKQAQLRAAAQDSARKVAEALSRELGSAAYVFDGTSQAFTANATAGPNDDLYANFLNLSIPKVDTTTSKVVGYVVGHAYNAKLDFVLARHQSSTFKDPTSGILTDPTTGAAVPTSQEPIAIKSKNGVAYLVPTDLQTPLAPSTTMIRYFVGLLDPTQPYENDRDHIFGNGVKPNPYVLYRAQFSPYNSDGTVNTNLFFKKTIGGRDVAVLDDPDFFRMVGAGDLDWLSATHAAYGAVNATDHNNRVKYWMEIAHPVISAPEIDLLVLPHNTDRTLTTDGPTDKFPGVPHYGFAHDPVAGAVSDTAVNPGFDVHDWPVAHTSIVFRPSTFTADAAPVTNSDYSSAGVPQMPQNAATGLPYIPTVYQTVGQSWTTPYTISIYPASSAGNPGANPYYTVTQALDNGTGWSAGDVVEYVHDPSSPNPPVAVYNVTEAQAIVPGSAIPASIPQYVPLSVNADAGLIDFDVVSLPNTNQKFQNRWQPTAADLVGSPPTLDLKALTGTTPNPLATINFARIVPGSIRVYGPDVSNGPNNGNPILYTPIGESSNATNLANKYQVDYNTGVLTFDSSFPSGQTVEVAYNYQANLTPANSAQPIGPGNPASPMVVKVDYHSRDNLFVQLGVRYFDADGNIQIVNLNSQIKVGNNNR